MIWSGEVFEIGGREEKLVIKIDLLVLERLQTLTDGYCVQMFEQTMFVRYNKLIYLSSSHERFLYVTEVPTCRGHDAC